MREIAPGVLRFESALWQTSSLLVSRGGIAVVVDPCISAAEIERIADAADALGVRVAAQLVTHSDWDHVCGLYRFPGAPAVMSTLAAAEVTSGRAGASVVARGAEEGLDWPGAPRADLSFEPGEAIEAGGLTVETAGLRGHTACGASYRVRDLGLLAVGDHLSAIEFPFVYSSTADYRATLAALISLLGDDPPTVVVPGHGPPLSLAEALEIAHADLAYLHDLKRTVRSALGDGRDAAVAAGAAVLPPRAGTDEPALTTRRANAVHQLAEIEP